MRAEIQINKCKRVTVYLTIYNRERERMREGKRERDRDTYPSGDDNYSLADAQPDWPKRSTD